MASRQTENHFHEFIQTICLETYLKCDYIVKDRINPPPPAKNQIDFSGLLVFVAGNLSEVSKDSIEYIFEVELFLRTNIIMNYFMH